VFFGIAALCATAMASRAIAAPMNFTVNPALSSISVQAYLGGPPAGGGTLITSSQDPIIDTTTTALGGTLVADISAPGPNISFPGGSNITYANQPINVLPDSNGGNAVSPDPAMTGGSPAQIGLFVNIPGLATGYLAISGALSDVTDFAAGGTPLAGGMFDATQQNILVTAGNGAYWINAPSLGGVQNGTTVLAPPALSAQNGVDSQGNVFPQNGSVMTVGPVSTITLPLFADQVVTLSGLPIDVIFTGQIVATSVPEPSTMVMAVLGLAGLVPLVVRRLRKA